MAGLRWAVLCLAALGGPLAAQENSASALASRYAAQRAQIEASALGVPVLVSSVETGEITRGELDAVLAQPFETLAAGLSVPSQWCQIVLLHLNIKACTHENGDGQDWLTLYNGRKVFERPDQAHPVRFAFRASDSRSGHLNVELSAPSGPMGTTDYRITLAAIPVAKGSFVRFSYAYRSSALSRLAINGYLATAGRGKVGFTTVGTGPDGKPDYVQGRRGIVERNAVRYYLAIEAYLEGLAAPAGLRFENNLLRWYELTERFPRQLHELERSEYLLIKRRELLEQTKLQKALDQGGAAAPKPPPGS